jgi:hypothetical protein
VKIDCNRDSRGKNMRTNKDLLPNCSVEFEV